MTPVHDLRPRPHHPTLRRGADSIQFGAGPGGSVELRGGPPALRGLLLGWRPEQPAELLLRRAAAAGLPESEVHAVLVELHRAGALAVSAAPDRVRAARASATVLVAGDGPPRAVLTEALAAAGVGLVQSGRADLVVLTGWPRSGDVPAGPHLLVRLVDGTGAVGPLVLPRRSACLRCLDRHLAAHDPCWPTVAADLAGRVGSAGPATVAATGALAAAQALAALDALAGGTDGPPPPTLDGVLELDPRRGLLHRRHWPPHPDCPCGARHLPPAVAAMCGSRIDGRQSTA